MNKIKIKLKNEKFACRQEQVCPDCGKVHRQQKTRRIKCKVCGTKYNTDDGTPYNSGKGWLTQRTVKGVRKDDSNFLSIKEAPKKIEKNEIGYNAAGEKK